MKKLENYKATRVELAKAHGVTPECIDKYGRDGGFRYAMKGKTRAYHKSSLLVTMGVIRANIKEGRHLSPEHIFPPTIKKVSAPKAAKTAKTEGADTLIVIVRALIDIGVKLDTIMEELGVEKKL